MSETFMTPRSIGLRVGQRVIARFTNNFNQLEFEGEITKLNIRTARVKSLKDGINGWNAGHEFIIQLETSPLCSANNCIKTVVMGD